MMSAASEPPEPAQPSASRRARLTDLRDDVRSLRERALKRESKVSDRLAAVHPLHRAGAVNLAHYLALRSRDLRPLQRRLSADGLSSLGRMESDVLGNLDAVIAVLDDAIDGICDDRDAHAVRPHEDLHLGAVRLFGGRRDDRSTRIMVTLPSEAAADARLTAEFAAAGMDVARINAAHDDPARWARMAENVRAADPAIPIAMDLAGPKIRTGPIAAQSTNGKAGKGGRSGKKHAKRKPRIMVHVGDTITLTGDATPAAASDGALHRIGCTLPAALGSARMGHRVAFDDGEITGAVVAVRPGEIDVAVTGTADGGSKLRAEKGINLPDTDIAIAALTDDDRAALPHIVAIADIVQLSFTRSAQDVRDLFAALDELGTEELGVVVKIETPSGFAALPEILLELMRRERVGVMIARGDLGVEVGFPRLAEVQEEMLWVCEAARVPVIWGTEVLDNLATTGIPTRAEVTDAAAGERAECVMLNKGPHIPAAIRTLDDIFRRMDEHVDKKRPLLRRLKSWQREAEEGGVPLVG